MHFDEVYHARTADRVPPGLALRHVARHLRMDPSAPRQVRDGRGLVALGPRRGQRHERSRRPGRRPPPSSRAAWTTTDSGRSRRRAAARRDRHRDPDLRPRDPRPGLDRAGRRASPPSRSTTPATSSSSATTTAGSPRSTSTSIDAAASTPAPQPVPRSGDRRPPGRRTSCHDDGTAARGRIGRPADRPSDLDGGTVRGTIDLPGHRRPGAGRDRAGPGRRRRLRDGRAGAAAKLADILGGDAADYEAQSCRTSPGHDRRPRLAGDRRRAHGLDAAIADGTLTGVRGRGRRRASRSRRGRASTFIDPDRAVADLDRRAQRRRARPGDGHRASTTRSCM